MSRRIFLPIYGISGAAALIYEVAWVRLLTLEMGHGIAAASTVLAAFMGGLALGAFFGGRIGDRLAPTRTLQIYAGLELAIAALALLLPFELAALRPLLAWAYDNGHSNVTFPLLRLTSSLALLVLPTAAMGATFPIASRWFIPNAAQAATDAGRLYAANTVGAALGAILAGFGLLPILGLHGTIWTGALLNVVAAAFAWRLAAGAGKSLDSEKPTISTPARKKGWRAHQDTSVDLSAPAWIAALAVGLSGFAAMTLQVVWTRILALILGPTTYAFSLIVAVFIAGLAVGTALASRLIKNWRHPILGLNAFMLAAVALSALAASGIDQALLTMADIVRQNTSFHGVLFRQTLLTCALLAPMAIAFGAVFPFAVAACSRTDKTLAADLGLLYAANTVGAIAGALLSGFVFITQFGLRDTIRILVVTVAVSGLLLLVATRMKGMARIAISLAVLLVLSIGIWLPPWNKTLLSSGAYKYASVLNGLDLNTWLTAHQLLYYREGAAATVAVRTATGATSLSIDGKVDASNAGDMLTQRLLAHLPLLLHPNPRRVAILGLGSGVTLGSALTHPIAQADAIEISPEVVEASRFFEKENHHALANPRTRLIVGDGRPHLALSHDAYDVIVSEPSNPWMAGISSLFTKEFFESARARLAPGGILCQWAHTYDISDDDLRSIVATFLSVFPDGTLWRVGEGDVLLLGSTGPLDDSLGDIGRHLRDRQPAATDLSEVGVRDEFALLSMFVAEGQALSQYADGASIQTDDLMALEFSGPRSIFGTQINRNDDLLLDLNRSAPLPASVASAIGQAGADSWRNRGWMLLATEAFNTAWRDFVKAIELDPDDVDAYEGLRRAAIGANRIGETLILLEKIGGERGRLQAGLTRSRLLAAQGAAEAARTQAYDIAGRFPGNLPALEHLASVLSDEGNDERLSEVVATLRRDAPSSESTHYYSAVLFFMQGRPDLAIPEAETVVRINPRNALAQNLLGAAYASIGNHASARSAFESSLLADPLNPGTYTNFATLEIQTGNPQAAARLYAEALLLNPASTAAREGLRAVTQP